MTKQNLLEVDTRSIDDVVLVAVVVVMIVMIVAVHLVINIIVLGMTTTILLYHSPNFIQQTLLTNIRISIFRLFDMSCQNP